MTDETVRAALARGTRALDAAGVPDATRDVRRLMAFALGLEAAGIAPRQSDPVSGDELARFNSALKQRSNRVPVSHIVGGRWFFGRWFKVTPATLDPRPDTETLIELALQRPFRRVLDLGTGTGCILITLLAERPEATGVGTDVSEEAVLVAGENASVHGVADRLILPLSDWFDDVGGRYDLIVSNPPYVSAREMPGLAPEVRHFEPRRALTDEGDGLDAYRSILASAMHHLVPGGRLIVEIGASQSEPVGDLFAAAGLESVTVHPDLNGSDRCVTGVAPVR